MLLFVAGLLLFGWFGCESFEFWFRVDTCLCELGVLSGVGLVCTFGLLRRSCLGVGVCLTSGFVSL